ncbi:MAG: Rpn family recombination-promoting nuclease/putative transposase, partial [Myxococcota bacterium]
MSTKDSHDHLFRYGFSRPDVAREHFEAQLPAAVVAAVDWTGLEPVPGTFIDPELERTESDILYRAPLKSGDELLLYVLFEHQRSRDTQMPFRLLQYMVRIWEAWLRSHGRRRKTTRLPFIVPMVLYNGTQRWTTSRQFADLFADGPVFDALKRNIPTFQHELQDLSQTPDEVLH